MNTTTDPDLGGIDLGMPIRQRSDREKALIIVLLFLLVLLVWGCSTPRRRVIMARDHKGRLIMNMDPGTGGKR